MPHEFMTAACHVSSTDAYYMPFNVDTDDILSEISQWIIVFSIIVTIIVYLGVGSDEDGGINLIGFVFIGLQLVVMLVACGIALSDLSHEKEYIIKQVRRSLSGLGFRQQAAVPRDPRFRGGSARPPLPRRPR